MKDTANSEKTDVETGRGIEEIAHDYLRAVEEHEAKTEELLSEWAEEYYRPGYLTDSEWEQLKDLLKSGESDYALMQVEIACYRKAATELERADEFEDEWPAKANGGPLDAD
ncbi:MAG: hypothetical protein HQRvContig04_41 [Haloquadratum phage sp.]|nr:MAG: hypothetical protein HQRvContig04_41 [Haloquadratum phage sp.]